MSKKRALTGIRPSGDIHIGNYLGMIRPALSLQKSHECLYFLADLHSLTTLKNPAELRTFSYDVTAAWLALGFDADHHMLYRQSDLPLTTECAWYLSCCTGVGFLEKAHAYKDAASDSRDVNHGVFAYPVLMAADIILYDADVVPVGKDQKQHVEMARDMAGSFNALFGDVFKLPQPLIYEDVMTVPGLDGRKMSKSYGNVIPLFCSESDLKKRVMSIKTDSTPVEAPKSIKGTLLGEYLNIFSSKEELADLEKRMGAGGMGWGHAKEELFSLVNRELSAGREKYGEFRRDEKGLEETLQKGLTKAYDIALPVLNRVRKAVGFKEFPYQVRR